jgi:hypothetical protein
MSTPVLDTTDNRAAFTRYAREVAAAVQGGRPLPASHPGRRDALEAMNALGYSSTYMAEQLGVQASAVPNLARRFGIQLTRMRGVVDRVAIDLVLQGDVLRLRGADLRAAIRDLAEAGKTATECARLLDTDAGVICRIAAELGVQLAKHTPTEGCWWVGYVDSRKRKDES